MDGKGEMAGSVGMSGVGVYRGGRDWSTRCWVWVEAEIEFEDGEVFS